MTLEAVENAVYAWITSISGAPEVLWAQYDAPDPEGDYISLRVESISTLGGDWQIIEPDGDAYLEKIEGPRRVAIRVRAMVKNRGVELIGRILAHLSLDSTREILNTAGVSFLRAEPIVELGAYEIDRYAGRAETTIVVGYVHKIQASIEIIESVEQTGIVT